MDTNLLIQYLSGISLQFETVIPFDFRGLIIPGATPLVAQGSFGTYCIQELKDKHFTIHYCVAEIKRRWAVRLKSPNKGWLARVVIQKPLNHYLDNTSEVRLKEYEFSKLALDGDGFVTEYENNTEYIHFDIVFSEELVEELRDLFPGKDLSTIPGVSRGIDATTREVIDSILYCRYKDEPRRHFFNTRMKDLLTQFMIQWFQSEPDTIPPTKLEIAAVHAAEKIVSEDLSRHINIPELARKVHLSEYRFKIVCKIILGYGAYEYFHSWRLKKVMQLLEEGYSVKEVATKTGYYVSHFITMFRDHFGVTPGSINRRKV